MASVDFPDDSGPKISTIRPRGSPPTPRATSRARAPVGTTPICMWVFSPNRMIEPLPNCFSIWPSAISRALSRSTGTPPGFVRLVVWGKSPGAAYRRGVTLTTTVEFHACQQQYLERSFASSIAERKPLQHRVGRTLRREHALVEHQLSHGEGLPQRPGAEGGQDVAHIVRHLQAGHGEMGVELLPVGLVAEGPECPGDGAGQPRHLLAPDGGADPHHPGPPRLRERAGAAEPEREGLPPGQGRGQLLDHRGQLPYGAEELEGQVVALPRLPAQPGTHRSGRCHRRSHGVDYRLRRFDGHEGPPDVRSVQRTPGPDRPSSRRRARLRREIVENCRTRSRLPGSRAWTASGSRPGMARPNHTVPTGWPSCSVGPATPVTASPTSAPSTRRAPSAICRADSALTTCSAVTPRTDRFTSVA